MPVLKCFSGLKTLITFYFLFCFFVLVVGPRAFCIPDSCSTTELQPQPLESQAVMNSPAWVLGTELQTFRRITSVLDRRCISPALKCTLDAHSQLLLCRVVTQCVFIVLPIILQSATDEETESEKGHVSHLISHGTKTKELCWKPAKLTPHLYLSVNPHLKEHQSLQIGSSGVCSYFLCDRLGRYGRRSLNYVFTCRKF